MTATRSASRSGCVAIQSNSAPMSLTESSRSGGVVELQVRLSVTIRPRTFGWITAKPLSPTRNWSNPEKKWAILPLRTAVNLDHHGDFRPGGNGLRTKHERGDRPFVERREPHQVRRDEAAGSSPPNSLKVCRTSVLSESFREYTSAGALAKAQVKPSSEPSGENSALPMSPRGSGTSRRRSPSSRYSLSYPFSLTTNATRPWHH